MQQRLGTDINISLLVNYDKPRTFGRTEQYIDMDLRALTQYMWQHVMAIGMESPEIKEIFKEILIEEMKHVGSIVKRIHYLGGTPNIIEVGL